MKVTTSRDPSARASRLGKTLASFLSQPHVNRGKRKLDAGLTWPVIVESHGNPDGLLKRISQCEELLAFKVSLEPQPRHTKRIKPAVIGEDGDAARVARFFELDCIASSEKHLPQSRAIVATSEQIDFVDGGETLFWLKI